MKNKLIYILIMFLLSFSFICGRIQIKDIEYEMKFYQSTITELRQENQKLVADNEEINKKYIELEKELNKKDTTIKEQKKTITALEKENKTLKKKKTVTTTKKETTATKTGSKSVYQDYAHDLVINQYKWTENDFSALVNLWEKESGWSPTSKNKTSGAYGIPQALPASKMSKFGSDYLTNYKTQIKWGLSYIKSRYGSPSAAWAHFCNKGWY